MFLDRLIDEATQAVEPESMIPLVMGTKQVGGAFVLPGILFDVWGICRSSSRQGDACLPSQSQSCGLQSPGAHQCPCPANLLCS